ncbi:alpha/beta hydrolase [Leucobacter sp. M11]|uniref:alpha/beta hydrolase n=1 Tax=Leucobacter sp. M11 TaxID=2993565 RepID=UPI002D80C16F|nr:alpha/beta hydrolase [Leucobacter sp. M11]MEB4613429.1 alpha/beta hydrolase [Leucobacter sp. M11]
MAPSARIRPLYLWLGGAFAVLTAIALVTTLSPRPTAMLIRAVFEAGGRATVAEMRPYAPTSGLTEHRNVSYRDGDPDATLSLFRPEGAAEPLPVVVWVHGGAWISGQKEDVEPYVRMIADRGFVAVTLDYSIGPEAQYPTAVGQINDALAFLNEHAAEYGIDPEQFVIAGDSAGAQLASQVTAMATNPQLATLMGTQPSLRPEQISGTILHCGVYDMRAMAELSGIENWGFKIALWATTGTRDWSSTYAGATMSSLNFVTEDFPTTLISGGNADALTWLQSIPMSQRLEEVGVDVESHFFAHDAEPALEHEYQFKLDSPEAQQMFEDTIVYLDRITERPADAGAGSSPR